MVKKSLEDRNIFSSIKRKEEKQNSRDFNPSTEKATSPKQSSDLKIRSFNAPLKQMNQSRGAQPNEIFQKNIDHKGTLGCREEDFSVPRRLQEDIKISALKIQGS